MDDTSVRWSIIKLKLFCFSSNVDETWLSCSTHYVLKFHQVSSKLDERQKSFIFSNFFGSDFQSVGRIVKIVHSEMARQNSKI